VEFQPLNKFEKEKKVIELHKEGKTIRAIAPIVNMSFRDISRIIKEYERKKRLEAKNKEENNQIKKPSLSSQSFKLFRKGKKPVDVAIELNVPFKLARRYWYQFLNLERMDECFMLYKDYRYEIPTLLSINNFIKRNNVSGDNIINVLKTANNVINLNQTYSNLKREIKYLEHKKMSLLYYSPSSSYSLQPLPMNKINYNYYRY
jgi:hypothetical protein